MLETKAFTVHPDNEQATLDLAANFGWRLKSSQEIKNTDSHLETRGDSVYSVTTSEHYVKLVMERDTAMENYARIVQLEKKFFSIMDQEPVMKEVRINGFIAFIGIICYVLPGVLYLVFKFRKRKKARKEYEEAYVKWQKQEKIAMECLEEARQLVM